MTTLITMPALSPTMTEGKLAKWLVSEGDTVSSGDVIAEIETDKAVMEVEALDDGVLHKINIVEGTEGVAVGEIIAEILSDDEHAYAETTSTTHEENPTSVVTVEKADQAGGISVTSQNTEPKYVSLAEPNHSGNMSAMTVREALRDAMAEEMRRDDKVFVMGEEVGEYQGVDKNNRITTLGRGGSDTTAVAIAASIRAKLCEIYTDVDGIFTADPRFVKQAKKLSKISYEETLEMASLGSKVLHPRSVELAMKYGIKLHVRNAFNNNNGTFLVKEDKEMEKELVSGISSTETESKITLLGIPDTPGVASKIFSPLTDSNINVDMIVQNITEDGKYTNLTFTVNHNETSRAVKALNKSKLKFKDIDVDKNICKLSIIGVGMKNNVGVAKKMFETLAKNKINIKVISTSEIKISVLISLEKKKLALNALHKAYNLGS